MNTPQNPLYFVNSFKKDNISLDLFFKKFTNLIMIDGKKLKASKILFNMLMTLKKKIKKDLEKKNQKNNFFEQEALINDTLLILLSKALENTTPNLEVRKVRVAGSTYLVPATLTKKKQETVALKWIIEAAKKRQKNTKINFSISLADEIFEASRKQGQARQKRDELHRLAQMNRAYVRYRWW